MGTFCIPTGVSSQSPSNVRGMILLNWGLFPVNEAFGAAVLYYREVSERNLSKYIKSGIQAYIYIIALTDLNLALLKGG